MKRTLLLVCCFITIGEITAQTEDEKWNIGVHGGATQYSGDLGQGFYSINQALYGFAGISVSRYLTDRMDATVLFTRGQAGYLASRDYSKDISLDYNYRVDLTTANVAVRYNLRDRDRSFIPYVFGGATVMRQRDHITDLLNKKPFEFGIPTGGVGFSYQVNPKMAVQFQEMFTYTSTDNVDHRVQGMNDSYLFHTLGLTFNIEKYRKMERTRAGHKIDRCYDMRTGYNKKYVDSNHKTKAKIKKHRR
ncbi:MAG: outer membrane beta-barrel protein [Bacteroidia bacterium]